MPDSTPTGIVRMEGDLYRGMTDSGKPMWVRVTSALFCLFALFLPGIFLMSFTAYVAVTEYAGNPFWTVVGFLALFLMASLLAAAGFIGIKAQFSRKRA